MARVGIFFESISPYSCFLGKIFLRRKLWETKFPLQTFQNYVLGLQGFILRCDYCVKILEGDLLFQFVPSPPAMAPTHPVTTQGQVTPSSSTTLPLSVGANRGHSFSMPDTGSLKRPSQVRDLFYSVALQGKLSSLQLIIVLILNTCLTDISFKV